MYVFFSNIYFLLFIWILNVFYKLIYLLDFFFISIFFHKKKGYSELFSPAPTNVLVVYLHVVQCSYLNSHILLLKITVTISREIAWQFNLYAGVYGKLRGVNQASGNKWIATIRR